MVAELVLTFHLVETEYILFLLCCVLQAHGLRARGICPVSVSYLATEYRGDRCMPLHQAFLDGFQGSNSDVQAFTASI